MRICVIAEGCYPFVAGGVSSWLQSLIQSMPQHEFVIWAIGAQEKQRGHFAYKLPENVVEVVDVYLDAVTHEILRKNPRPYRLTKPQKGAIREMLATQHPDWAEIFALFAGDRLKGVEFLVNRDFFSILQEVCLERYPYVGFSDLFWTMRSMFLPLLYLLGGKPPEADLYHSVSAGYAGVLGSMAAQLYHKPYVLTEHGIYTREREEEILRTDWVPPHFKDLWINMFYMFTRCAYHYADQVTSLFLRASQTQQEIGCPADKCRIIRNGVHVERFASIPLKEPDGTIDIGAIVRIVPIKDIKTMLYSFSRVSAELPNVRLHIMGPTNEDEEYYMECLQLQQDLELSNVVFTGRVNVPEYLRRIDFTLLTSISEGQPLAVLEAMAAGRPAVTTNVGCCMELLAGVDDGFGSAGLCVPVMHQGELADAMLTLCQNDQLRRQMGENGRKRAHALYAHEQMIANYLDTYQAAGEIAAEKWRS
ncbi:MAG: GT4 family glycosyltransferase PelF [Eubacteriales bacterium]|nr:GT4 family glycosyltransferase PelF [Eubacteriales bacterium]